MTFSWTILYSDPITTWGEDGDNDNARMLFYSDATKRRRRRAVDAESDDVDTGRRTIQLSRCVARPQSSKPRESSRVQKSDRVS